MNIPVYFKSGNKTKVKTIFRVIIENYQVIDVMPNGWSSEAYRRLLKTLEFEELPTLSEEELSGYSVLALQELEPEEAATIVLRQLLPSRIKDGQIQNLREDMKVDRQWEENPDMGCHELIFNAQLLLSEAFPDDYQKPDVGHLTVRFESDSTQGAKMLRSQLDEPKIVRLLACGMSDNAVLKRLFDDSLREGSFSEASEILWQYNQEIVSDDNAKVVVCRVDLFSPNYWISPMEDVDIFEGETF